MIRTTVELDDAVHALAVKHGINLSRTARRAITVRAEQAEAAEKADLQKLQQVQE